jgi:hypothetical protein
LTAKKLRLLEIRVGSQTHKGVYTGTSVTRQRMRAAERELAAQAESAYKRTVAEGQRTQAKRGEGRRRDTGTRISWAVERPSSAARHSPKSCALARRLPTPAASLRYLKRSPAAGNRWRRPHTPERDTDRADPAPSGRNHSRRSRSAAPRRRSETDPTTEIGQKPSPGALDVMNGRAS